MQLRPNFIRKILVLLCFCCGGINIAIAQLSDMIVEGIDITDKVNDGPVNPFSKKPWALFMLEVNGTPENKVNGEAITVLKQKGVTPSNPDDILYDAYAGAWTGNFATSITLHHPDFNNCKAVFADYLGEKPLEGGTVYKIRLKIPSARLIEANKHFNDLDFESARHLYSQIASDSSSDIEEKLLASNHLTYIDSLISLNSKALKYEITAETTSGRERDRALYRARICYNRLYKDSGVYKALMKIEHINELLDVKGESSQIPGINVIKKVSAEMAPNDLRASGNDAVTYEIKDVKNSQNTSIHKSALFILDIPLKGLEISSDRIVGEPIEKNGEHWIYVTTEIAKTDNSNPAIFSITHPDYKTFTFCLKDLDDGSTIEAERVYKIKLDTPTLIMSMANKQLASLELAGAKQLFNYNFEDGDEQAYADRCLEMLESCPIVEFADNLNDDTHKCRSLEKQYFSIVTGGTKFDSVDERNKKLNAVNAQLENAAAKLAEQYGLLYSEALKNGIELSYANEMSKEFNDIKVGVRRLPLIIEFKEMKDLGNGMYGAVSALSSSPVIKIEFIDDKGKTVQTIVQQAKEGKVSAMANTSTSRLFSRGIGKIKISTPKNLNVDSKNKPSSPYRNSTVDIHDYKISDYTTKCLSLTIFKK